MIPPSDQEGAAEPPPTPPPKHENPLSEKIRYMGGDLPGTLGEPLRVALNKAQEQWDLVLLARVQAVSTRAAEPTSVTAARLELPESGSDRLGVKVETQLVADKEQVRIWLAGADQIEPGSRLTLHALTPDGEVVETAVVADRPQEPIALELPWGFSQAPEAVALGVVHLR